MQSVEAARESGMAAVVVAGQQPLYELGAADLVVRQLDELTFINLKQLFRNEAHVEGGAVRPAQPPICNWLIKGCATRDVLVAVVPCFGRLLFVTQHMKTGSQSLQRAWRAGTTAAA